MFEFLSIPLEILDNSQIMAMVRNLKTKKGTGKGKGARKCFECD